jgi:hypothetical protein
MIVTIVQMLAIPAVRWAVTAFGVAAIFGLWLIRHDARVAERARSAVVAELNEDAGKKINDAVEARKPAERPGAAERLRRHSCRDC